MKPRLAQLLLCCCGILASAPAGAEDTAFIAKVNGTAIPSAALDRALHHAIAAGQRETPELRATLIEGLIAHEILWQEAQRMGLDRTPEADRAADFARRESAIVQYARQASRPAEVTDDDVRQRYEAIIAVLGPKEYLARVIEVGDPATVQQIRRRLEAGTRFAEEARRLSRAPSATRGGQLDWVSFPLPPVAGRTGGLPLPVARALAALRPGQTSAPIRLADSWVLLRLDAVRPTVIPSYDEAAPVLRQALAVRTAEAAGVALANRLVGAARVVSPDTAGGNPP